MPAAYDGGMSSQANLEGARVSVVTGGVRGIGLAVARALRDRGDVVHITFRSSRERAGSLESEFPGRIHQVDFGSEQQTSDLFAQVGSMDMRIDHVIHAVGDYETGSASTADVVARMWQSNVQTAMHVASAACPELRKSKGSLVLFGCAGLAGLGPRRDSAAYAAAKSALVVLMKSLATEQAPFGARVNMISPGLIPHDAAHAGTLAPELLAKIPMGRPGTPEEVAAAALWLTSGESSYTTGADIPVSGGWML